MEETKLDAKIPANSEIPSENEKSEANETAQNNEDTDIKEEIKKKATLLFLQGKRSIYIKDFSGALATLSECCMLFSQIYPEQDEALADPYFYYGKALLEVGRSESEVLGDQVQEDDEDEDDEEESEDEGEGEDAGKNENQTNAENGINSAKNNLPEKEGQEKEDAKNNVDVDNGEVNDLQLSWEYLELAKLIYLKKADTCKETAIKLAETYLCLGENGLESENYSTAIEDIKQALELQKKHLSSEDRRIAETHYQLGIAFALGQNYDQATESFKNAIEQLEKKISSLEMRKEIGDKKTEEEEKDAFYTMDGEINEIRNIIKEIDEKIKDMLDSKSKVKAEILKQVYGQSSSSTSTSTDVPQIESTSSTATRAATTTTTTTNIVAKDISHLVKRKRKSDENEVRDDKKMKPSD